jgi:DNA repair/transcription protein MET18/MMS19
LQSLDATGADADALKDAALGTLSAALEQTPAVLEEHAGSLVARFLANGVVDPRAKEKPRARVRALALGCLMRVAEGFGTGVVLRYRREVVKRLGGALDDGKREVRAAAVRCRAKWAGVDEVGDDD